MDSMRHSFALTELCSALGVSRSGHHAAGTRLPGQREESNERLLAHMISIHEDRHTRCYGSPRMTRELQSLGLPCSENRVARLMRSAGLRARPLKAFPAKDHAPRSRRPSFAQSTGRSRSTRGARHPDGQRHYLYSHP